MIRHTRISTRIVTFITRIGGAREFLISYTRWRRRPWHGGRTSRPVWTGEWDAAGDFFARARPRAAFGYAVVTFRTPIGRHRARAVRVRHGCILWCCCTSIVTHAVYIIVYCLLLGAGTLNIHLVKKHILLIVTLQYPCDTDLGVIGSAPYPSS